MAKLTINLPAESRAELEDRLRHTEFESLEEYVQFVLQTIIEEGDQADNEVTDGSHDDVEERLKDLGYM